MNYYHIIIKQERRTGDRATAINVHDQLHTMGALPLDLADPQFVMVAEWDLQAPYVIQHKGDYAARKMSYAGWPDMTEEEYKAQKEKGDAPLGTPP